MTGPRIVGLLPMRHASERVVGKNYRPLGGRPLFQHVLDSLLESGCLAEVVIDTDSPVITGLVAERYPQVRVIDRPAHLLGGDVPMNEILLHDMSLVAADYYLQTHSTNPLLRSSTIRDAVTRFLDAGDAHDSLFAVTGLQTRLWWADATAINHDPGVLLRTQDLPPVYEENSNLYLFPGDVLARRGNRIGERPMLYPIDRAEAWDIDEEIDWLIVESLYAQREAGCG